jgi:hypothetical protein
MAMMRWFFAATVLAAMTTGLSGCAMCDHADDDCGSYYGGIVGHRAGEGGRVGSAYASDVISDGDVDSTDSGDAQSDDLAAR